MGWGSRGVPAGIPVLVHPKPWLGHAAPPAPQLWVPRESPFLQWGPAKPRGLTWAPALPGHPQVAELPCGTVSGTIFKNTY